MSKRKDKENLPNEICSKKSKVERQPRATNLDAFPRKLYAKIESEPISNSSLSEM